MPQNKRVIILKKQKALKRTAIRKRIHSGSGILTGVFMDSIGLGLCLGVSTGMYVGLAAGSFWGTRER